MTPVQEEQVETLVSKYKKAKLVSLARGLDGFMEDEQAEEATKKDIATFIALASTSAPEQPPTPEADEPQAEPEPAEAEEGEPEPADKPEPLTPKSAKATKEVENYLAKYEVKVNSMDESAKKTRAELLKMTKVATHIPLAQGEAPGQFQPININGYQLLLPKQVQITLPEEIVRMIGERYGFELGSGNNPLDVKFRSRAGDQALA